MSDTDSLELGLFIGAILVILFRALFNCIRKYATPCFPGYCAAVAAAGPEESPGIPLYSISGADDYLDPESGANVYAPDGLVSLESEEVDEVD